MDPNEALRLFWDAIDEHNMLGAREAFYALRVWMNRGGFEPDWTCGGRGVTKDDFMRFNPRRGAVDWKPLAYPDAASFWDIFDAFALQARFAKEWDRPFRFIDFNFKTGKRKAESIKIRAHLFGTSKEGSWGSVYALPKDGVVDFIRSNMIAAGVNDEITFKMVRRKDRDGRVAEVLLTAENSVIIGGRWLAIVDPETIPDFENAPADGVVRRPQ